MAEIEIPAREVVADDSSVPLDMMSQWKAVSPGEEGDQPLCKVAAGRAVKETERVKLMHA